MAFTRGDFHWCADRIIPGQTSEKAKECQIEAAVLILNKLSPMQQEAVRLYGRSCREEGCDETYDTIREQS